MKKGVLSIIILFFIILFVVGSCAIYNIVPESTKPGAYFFIAILGIVEYILLVCTTTSPYFQNLEDFEIFEKVNEENKIINIRYKDYEFEFFNQFDVKQLKNAEKNKKRISIFDKYKIKRFYKYALLNLLNKPMNLKNIEEYESVRRATDDEILEYSESLKKIGLEKRGILRKIFMILFIIAIFISILGCWMTKNLEFIIIIVFDILIFGAIGLLAIRTPKYYRDKQISKAKKIFKILNESEIFVIEAKEFLYKFISFGSEKRGYVEKVNRFCLFNDENGYYINEWFWDAEIYDSIGGGRQEFPNYSKSKEKIFIIKNGDKIIVDRKN